MASAVTAAVWVCAMVLGSGPTPALAQQAGESATPQGCHWVDVAGGQQHLWCEDRNGRFFDTGQTHSTAATADSTTCPRGLTFDGAECIAPPVAAPAPRAQAAPGAQPAPRAAPAPAPVRRAAATPPAQSAPQSTTRTTASAGQLATARRAIEADAGFWANDTQLDKGSLHGLYAHTTSSGLQRVHADFTYNHGKAGWADAEFQDGVVSCIEYFDTNGSCAYARSPEDKERYEKEHPPVTIFDLFAAPSRSTNCVPIPDGNGNYRGQQYCQ